MYLNRLTMTIKCFGASTKAVSCDLIRGLPTGIFDYVRFIFVKYVRIVLQCKPDVKLSCVILCWINPCLSMSLSLNSILHIYRFVKNQCCIPPYLHPSLGYTYIRYTCVPDTGPINPQGFLAPFCHLIVYNTDTIKWTWIEYSVGNIHVLL